MTTVLSTPRIFCPSNESVAHSCPDIDSTVPRRVHVVAYHAVFGLHSNYYHWFYGRLSPFLNWLQKEVVDGDIIILIEHDAFHLDKHIQFILDKLVSTSTCAIPILAHLGADKNVYRTILRQLKNIDPSSVSNIDVYQWPLERGFDLALYICSSLKPATQKRIRFELKNIYNFLRESCGCCSNSQSTITKKPLITLVDRGVTNRKRAIPNIAEIYMTLHEGLGSDVEIQRIDFAGLDNCGQWCTAHSSSIIIGQHGAGLSNIALLEEGAALIEIIPTDISFKGMYQCISKLRGVMYHRTYQNGTHGNADTHEILDVVKNFLKMSNRKKAIHVNKAKFFSMKPSKKMMNLKCPSKLGEFAPAWEHGDVDVTSLLVRSNECDSMKTVQSPSKMCFRGGARSITFAQKKCSYAIVTMAMASKIGSQSSLELFIRTLERFERHRTLYIACDSEINEWISRIYEKIQLEIKPVKCLDKYQNKPSGSGDRLAWITAMKVALGQGHPGCLYVDKNVVFLKPFPIMASPSLGVYRDKFHSGEYHLTMFFARNNYILDSLKNASEMLKLSDRDAILKVASTFEHFTIADNSVLSSYKVAANSSVNWFHLSKLTKVLGRKLGLTVVTSSSRNEATYHRELVWGRSASMQRVDSVQIDPERVRPAYLT